MKYNTRDITFHQSKLVLTYRDVSDISVIEELFVDRLYRCVEDIIPTLEHPILDIGAHTGLFSIYARILNPDVTIIAGEPESDNFDIMKKNIKQNHIKNITTKQVALSHTADENVKLYISEDSHNHTTTPDDSTTQPPDHISVPSTTLDKLITQYNFEKIGLLKMDIEGAEYEILKNMGQDTWNKLQHIVLEYHNDHYDKKQLEQIIREHGFSVQEYPSPFDQRYGLFLCRNKRHKT